MDNGRGGGWRGGGGGWGRGGGGRFPWRAMYKKRGGNGFQGGRGRGQVPADNGEEGSAEGTSNRGYGRGSNGRGWISKGRWNNSPKYNQGFNRPDNDNSPPRKKKRTDAVQTIKANVEKKWRELLPNYDLYYEDGPPQLPETDKKIEAMEQYLHKTPFVGGNVTGCERTREGDLGEEQQQAYFSLIYEDVIMDERFCELWEDFGNDLVNQPEDTLNLWSAAAHKVLYNAAPAEVDRSSKNSQPPEISKIRMGFFRRNPVTPLASVKSDHIGKFVTIKGTVVSASNLQRYCRTLTFKCKFCDGKFTLRQPEGKYACPSECKATAECSNTFSFEPLENEPTTVILDSRRIRLQDELHCDIERGTIPKTIECILFGRDWAEMCNTGDVITLSGILKMGVWDKSMHRTASPSNYIEVSAIQQQKDSERTMGGNLFSFSDKDYYAVRAIHDEPNLFRLLVTSLCPAIYGHELVKAGLLLSLFGGTGQSQGLVSRRSDINMLMIGDPGIGKSQMLKVITDVAPKAVYICGTGSTTAGLTVSMVKDGDDYSLEAGALVMADKGICCIDEFDKMGNHQALLEAMEQQSVSVAKSGVHRTLPARTSVIAAANPVGGHYNSCKTIVENIKIHPAILSRFDLIFILLDKPNEEFDQGLVAHKAALRMRNRAPIPGHSSNMDSSHQILASKRLIDKIKVQIGDVFDLVPQQVLRKYIAYAKQYVHPKLSTEAVEILKKYYMNLRLSRRAPDSTPITARQLESLVRLAQARAKVELRVEVTADDANDILELFEFSLSSAYDEEVLAISALSDSISLNSSGYGSGSSKNVKSTQGQAKQLIAVLRQQSVQQSKSLFSHDEIKRMVATLGYSEKTEALIAMLNNNGLLLKKGGSTYKLSTEGV